MKEQSFYVISGGPGVGKTTLINGLRRAGFFTVEEDARRIIKEQMARGGSGLPWKDKAQYARLMLDASVNTFQKVKAQPLQDTVFFDRGVLDTICYMAMEGIQITPEVIARIGQCTYHSNVFILPPWNEIYTTDDERKQSWEEAIMTYNKMREIYSSYGYTVTEVPKIPVNERVQFVIDSVSVHGNNKPH